MKSMSSNDNLQNIPVFDFMTRNVRTITENETMKQASKLMYQEDIGSVVILRERDTDDHNDDSVTQYNREGSNTDRNCDRKRYC